MTSLIAGRPLVPGEAPLTKDSVNYAKWDPKIETDDRDKNTSDEWIPRHPELIRLTGRHPFNAEPPPKLVHDAGFMTPTSLHLVRNHGAVPKLEWSTHRIHIHGLVERPIELTMDELLQFPAVTVTCLITCCGNRRKEVNIVKKSQGFSWGPAAVSVNEWTGARLGDVLRHVGVKGPMDGAKWVNFRGPVGELPKGDDGSYGTGMTLAHAMDPANDVLIAYKQNGQFLHPDHGFPCRMLIPGWIGGRMVKWLSDITVAPEESTNWYHYHDNKVLPPFVDADLAAAEGWWKRPEFVLWDLNINSSIVYPGHDDTLLLDSNRPYTMQGYAYSGGGRKIQRVEVSFDNQKTWKLADLHMKEQPSVHGKYWCWVQWTLDVCTFDFLQAETVVCRAWDYGQNTQPAVLTWTLLGQGNNCMFMLKIHKEADEQGRLRLRFQQPAPMLPGELGNVGWREEEAAQEVAAAPPAPAKVVDAPVASAVKEYTMAEVEQHTSEESAWFVYEGSVYDGTTYLDDHPGGADSIILAAGTDATDEFNSIHSIAAKELLEKYKIGKLVEKKSVPNGVANGIANGNGVHIKADATGGDLVALNPRKKQAFKLMEKTKLSHNTYLFRFALQSKEHRLGLPVGKHMFLYANIGGETVMRAYTPSSSDDQLGYFDLVIKVYWKDEHPKFPLGGKMSQYMAQLEAGDTMDVKGPVGHFVYNGLGSYTINGKRHGQASVLSMIAGGTGITPMFQVIQHIVSRPEDKTRIRLLYANQTEDDILLREELEKWAAEHDNFELWYTLDRPPAGWKYSSGFINEDMIRDHLYAPGSDSLVLMCGPPPMLKYACVPNLTKVGHKEEAMVTF